ncbi:MAG TPA: hypothetical protein VLA61_21140 [Ideonella sp.]|uniref:hypothetical protein n=1 Tax=Ideonella sp. TaxID=1929293 RepID=UPI002CEF490D|nr:hypothetical protein [Ideonella sp.]HSI50782.1 hypothetical protein [Ideonella sp.]
MEETVKIAEIAITDPETLRVLRVPQAATWIERELSTPDLEPFVMVSARRFGGASSPIHLLPPPIGALSVFKIGALPKYFHFPDWMRADIPRAIEGRRLISAVHETLERKVHAWAKDRPWLKNSARRERDVAENLKSIGDWSFRLSKNEGLHPYPGTFVHAIPSALIGALGLKGAVVLDPFGGTGQTASEVIKSGGTAISADSNSVATLIARAKLTYLSREQRDIIRSIRLDELRLARAVTPPSVELIGKWHHPDTIAEICQIKGFIDAHTDATVRQLLLAALSAVLPATTARKGKEHGFFADNTPLGAAYTEPPYQPAYIPFLQRVLRNLDLIDKLYASIEANGRVPEEELSRASILRADSRIADAATYNISPNSVDAIITSPPYLCMVDYSLGQRLSYYWLDPDRLELDFSHEIGARRRRSNPVSARNKYLDDLRAVAKNASNLLREGGYFATVLGAPVANAFLADRDMHDAYDEILREAGFSLLWKHWRDIHWHRNHGYQRLRQERISVHVLKGG